MKHIKTIILPLIFIFIGTSHLYSQDVIAKLENLVDDYYKMDLFSGTVLVLKKDTPILEKAVGYSNMESKTPNNMETVFNIGSIQKTFTHELVKMLIGEGKLKYSDKLGKYISGFSDKRAEDATIDQIIAMKGGFGDFVMIPDIQENPKDFSTVGDFLAVIKEQPLLFAPGTDRQYSNSGYVILGAVIEKITGKSYEEFLTERILNPLGMEHSYFIRAGVQKPNKASGYMVGPDGSIFPPRSFDLAPTPAGSMYSNVGDLLKFVNYLWNKTDGPVNNAFAGGLPGWNSIIGMLGDKENTIIILSNYDEPSAEVLFDQVVKVLKGKDYDPPKQSIGNFIFSQMKDLGKDEFIGNYEKILKDNGYKIEDDRTLNSLGYTLLNGGLITEAIAIFELNVKLYPDIANCYDSLGEAFMNSGNKEEAIKNYETVIKMDPGNTNAQRMLEKLKSM